MSELLAGSAAGCPAARSLKRSAPHLQWIAEPFDRESASVGHAIHHALHERHLQVEWKKCAGTTTRGLHLRLSFVMPTFCGSLWMPLFLRTCLTPLHEPNRCCIVNPRLGRASRLYHVRVECLVRQSLLPVLRLSAVARIKPPCEAPSPIGQGQQRACLYTCLFLPISQGCSHDLRVGPAWWRAGYAWLPQSHCCYEAGRRILHSRRRERCLLYTEPVR